MRLPCKQETVGSNPTVGSVRVVDGDKEDTPARGGPKNRNRTYALVKSIGWVDHLPSYALIAQSGLERLFREQQVLGSNPSGGFLDTDPASIPGGGQPAEPPD